jgi:hypothetical protein
MAKVSLIITTFNRPHLLPRAVESAQRGGQDVEVIVVDDASTDAAIFASLRLISLRPCALVRYGRRGQPIYECCTVAGSINLKGRSPDEQRALADVKRSFRSHCSRNDDKRQHHYRHAQPLYVTASGGRKCAASREEYRNHRWMMLL